jgi:protocatechuate 3,4-dioxygenase beta subunit
MREVIYVPGRRRFFRLALVAPVVVAAGFGLPWPAELAAAAAARAALTPECGDDDEPTPEETAGPFFKPRSPLRTSLLEPGLRGTRMVVSGRVFGRECRPLAGALLDFWQAGDDGEYDNQGFRLRGHQFADEQGRYHLETVVPGLYPGRTRHYHVRVQAPGGRVLTTQLYFPGEARNRRDFLYRPDLQMAVARGIGQAHFHFTLDQA